MASVIKMPPSGQNAAESLIVRWNVKEGDQVNRGDVLFEIETDKATMNVESFAKGAVLKILHGEGESVEAGQPVAYIGKPGEQIGAEAGKPEAKQISDKGDEEEYAPIMPKAQAEETKPKAPERRPDGAVIASPKARAAAKEKGLDIAALYGRLGRPVRFDDIKTKQTDDGYTTEKTTSMRRTIARRMTESLAEAPQFTVSTNIDMTEMIEARKQINDALAETGVKVSYNDLLVKAVCAAAEEVPCINAVYGDDEIRTAKHTSVGIAVALDGGLVVPVIKNADTMTLRAIAGESRRLIDAARGGGLTQDMMSGGTITISNLGMYGIDRFTAIINRPESAILAVGAIIDMPAVLNRELTIRPMMNITASFDHRIIDGGVGAQFMSSLKKLIENPLCFLV